MRILITNDDGIHAPGLVAAEKIAREVVGDAGEVWVVAPMAEMSGVGHCISYTKPVRSETLSQFRHSVDGTPADCVMVALSSIMADTPPDLVLSGVNAGNNSGENTLYSGTVGAAMEAALQGVKAIALSQYFGPNNNMLDNVFEASESALPAVIDTLYNADWGAGAYNLFYNVNVPPVPAKDVKGTRVVAQGRRPDVNFSATKVQAPNRREYFWIHGSGQHIAAAPDTDVTVNLDGYVSVTPCIADLTDHDRLAATAALF